MISSVIPSPATLRGPGARLSSAILAALAFGICDGNAGLLAHYPFDTDMSDASGNGNHLTIGAGTPETTTAAGETVFGGGALDIDSTTGSQGYLNLTTPITFATGAAWSVSFWARHRPGNDGRTGMILGNLNSSDFIWVPRDGAVGGLRFRNSSGQDADYTSPPAGVEPAGVYHHWALVADGSGAIEVFYDNVSLGTQMIATTFNITSVGQAFHQTTQSMNGQIDELYIYDEAIDSTKVDDLFRGVTGPDNAPPTLGPEGITDDRSGGPVAQGSLVTYTVTFNEDMDAATVDSSDFENTGSAPIVIGAVSETSPGVFSISVTPTGTGTLSLAVVSGAELRDSSGNLLDTGSAIVDDTSITVEATPTPPPVTRIRAYLLGGQSNADGRGSPSGLPTNPVNLQQPQDDIDFFHGSTLTTLRPLSQFGPEITLGRRLSDTLVDGISERVAIIKSASGGTSLAVDWKPGGDATTTGDGPLYLTFQQRVTSGLAALAAAYPEATITIDGMLWVQGERDAKGGFENEYEANLTAFIADVRATYGAGLPFVISRLAIEQTNIPATQLAIVRAAQTAVADADPRAPLLDTDGFGMQGDNLHFDTVGQQQIGDGSAEKLLALVPFDRAPLFGTDENGDLKFEIENAFPGFIYTLQSNPTLQSENWTDEESLTASGSGVVFNLTPSATNSPLFFRIARSAPR